MKLLGIPSLVGMVEHTKETPEVGQIKWWRRRGSTANLRVMTMPISNTVTFLYDVTRPQGA
jgi:hypothetical protein